jgi:hypothetical protein
VPAHLTAQSLQRFRPIESKYVPFSSMAEVGIKKSEKKQSGGTAPERESGQAPIVQSSGERGGMARGGQGLCFR